MSNEFSPPPISPHQMDILRAVTAMAWADGQLDSDEITMMLEQFGILFFGSVEAGRSLSQDLREYLDQNIPLAESLTHLRRVNDRKLVLKLSYQVIQASRRHPDEPSINLEEATAYQNLLQLLDLPAFEVAKIEAEAINNNSADMSTLTADIHQSISNA